MMIDKYQTEVEVLGAALSTGITPEIREAYETLTPEMFTGTMHSELFTVIWSLYKSNLVINAKTVAFKCDNRQAALEYCQQLSEGFYGYQITAYAKQLRLIYNAEKASSKLAQLSQLITTDLENSESHIADLLKIADSLTSKKERSRKNVMDGITEFLDDFEQAMSGNADVIGLDIGLDMPIERNDLLIIGGQPGMGKTALMQYVITELALNGHHSLVFSLEMKFKELFKRIVARESKLDSEWIKDPAGIVVERNKHISDDERDRRMGLMGAALKDKVERMDIMIDDTPFLNLNDLRYMVRQYLNERPDTKVICIDYLTLMEMPDAPRTDLEIAKVTRACKLMAKEFNVPFVILSQLNRDSDKQGREPTIRDLKDSGAIEQDADKIIFPYRPKQHEPDDPLHGYAKILKRKVRGGKVGNKILKFTNGNFYQLDEGETVDFDEKPDPGSEFKPQPYVKKYARK